MKARLALAGALVAVAALGSLPAHAGTVTVKFGLSAGAYAPSEVCAVSVPADSNGIAVLDAAKAAHCIVSYVVEGGLVACIDEVCGWPREPYSTAHLYWAMFLNGGYAQVGVEDYQAAAEDRLGFSYTRW